MSGSQITFYVISAVTLGAGLLAVTSSRIFRSAIWMLLSLVGIAGLYFWMQVEFIAAVQIIVYVGGIVVLIIFSIFLTQESGKEMPGPQLKRKVFAVLAALFGFVFTYNLVTRHSFSTAVARPFNIPVSEIGFQLLSTTQHGYLLPFEVVSMLLLAAMIGCIVIAMKKTGTKPPLTDTTVINKIKDAPAPEVSGSPSKPLPELIIEEV